MAASVGAIKDSDGLPLHALLDFDRRPTFLVQYEIDSELKCTFANSALRALPTVLAAIHLELSNNFGPSELKTWLNCGAGYQGFSTPLALLFRGQLWDICSKSGQWLMISARLGSCPTASGQSEALHNVKDSCGAPSIVARTDRTNSDDHRAYEHDPKSTAVRKAYKCSHAALIDIIDSIKHVAIIVTTPDGEIKLANNHWYEVTQHSCNNRSAFSWIDTVEDEDVPRIHEMWTDIMNDDQVGFRQAKLKRRWKSALEFGDAGSDQPIWILCSGNPDWQHGTLVGVSRCIINISSPKWLEKKQAITLDRTVSRADLRQQVADKTEEAAANESRFRKLADDLPAGVYIAGLDTKIHYANSQYWSILGIDSSTDGEQIWLNAIQPDQLAYAAEAFNKVYVQKKPTGAVEIRLKRHYNRPTLDSTSGNRDEEPTFAWALFQAFPELNPDGSLRRVMGCVTDISHQKWMEQFLRRQKEEALTARVQQEKFMDMTSHELRNPLGAIVHCAEEIEESLSHEDVEKLTPPIPSLSNAISAAKIIISCSQHARRIMDDVLTFSKMRSLLLKIAPSPCQPGEVFSHAFPTFRGDTTVSQAQLTFSIDESITELDVDWVLLDAGRFMQILTNLVSNALKFVRTQPTRKVHVILAASIDEPSSNVPTGVTFLPTNTEQPKTSATRSDTDRQVFIHVAVQDTGCGIAQEEQAKLFGRFYQASHRSHVNYGGSGLGLSISKELCEMQGGQIGFQSDPATGSTFCFFVKTLRVPAPEPSRPDSSTETPRRSSEIRQTKVSYVKRKSTSEPVRPSSSDPSSLDVLVVEDNLVNQQILRRQLEKQGCRVAIANNGVEALAAIKGTNHWVGHSSGAQRLSLILLDIEMPVMDGLTCIREIRKLQGERCIKTHIPVIAITANAREEQVDTAAKAGMDRVLIKPFHARDLWATIQGLITSN